MNFILLRPVVKKIVSGIIFISALKAGLLVKRVEPPTWWNDFDNRNLQIMVYGENMASVRTVEIYHKPRGVTETIRINKIKRTENPDYLFLDLELGHNLESGEYNFLLKGTVLDRYVETSFKYYFNSKVKNRVYANGFNSSDVLYLLMPDRFSNGNTKNDNVDGLLAGTNRKGPGERHGGDLDGVIDQLKYLKKLGITTIWMTPVFENDMPVSYGEYNGHVYGSYHGYAITDFYNIDRRFGVNDDYRYLVEKAHEIGIKVVMDVVHNHVGSHHWWFLDPPSSDWFNNKAEHSRTNYRTIVYNDPYASKFDIEHLTMGPFDDAMPDLNQRNLLLSNYLIQHSLWWIEYSGIDGIRMDTYPYSSKEHMARWCKAVLNEYPNFTIVGEAWANSPPSVAYWQSGFPTQDGYESYLPSIIDFPLSFSIGSALSKESKPRDIENIYYTLAQDFVYPAPYENIIFLDNHDTDRFYEVVGSDIRKYKTGIALLLTMRGVPQFYYGTEINLYGSRSDGDAFVRKDFPGGWKNDKRNAFTKKGRTEEENEIWDFCSKLLNWRKNNKVIHTGKTMQFAPDNSDPNDADNVYALFRYNKNKIVGLFINPDKRALKIETKRFSELILNMKDYVDVIDGQIKEWGEYFFIEENYFRLIEFEI